MGKYYRINTNIPNRQLRVIDNDGNNLGLLDRDEAIRIAKEKELDLVEIAPQANPPVAKIVEFQKFRYEENKKEQAAKRKTKEVELKELWLTPRMADHDLNTRLKRAEEFLEDGDKIMFRVKFRGREMGNVQMGFDLLDKVFVYLDGKASVERPPKLEGRSITTILGKSKGAQKVNETKQIESEVTK